MKSLMQNRGSIDDELLRKAYAEPGLVPASTWLDNNPPDPPSLLVTSGATSAETKFVWQPTSREKVWLWVVQQQSRGTWTTEILPAWQTSRIVSRSQGLPAVVAVSAVDRCGNLS